jgi:hypothetical protein
VNRAIVGEVVEVRDRCCGLDDLALDGNDANLVSKERCGCRVPSGEREHGNDHDEHRDDQSAQRETGDELSYA